MLPDNENQEADTETLSPEEQKYFESRGEAEVAKPEEKAEKQEESKPESEAKVEAKTEAEDGEEEADETPLKEGEKGNQGRFVRHGAFHQEREKRKALEKEVRDRDEKLARLDERVKLINEALTRPAQQQEADQTPPDPETDIFGYLKHLGSEVASLKGGVTEVKKTNEQATAQSETLNTYRSDAARFANEHKDFGDAYQFAITARDKELEALGYTDPAQRAALINQEEQWIVTEALKAKQSPAERIYRFAQVKGFKAPAPKVEEKKPAGNGAEKIDQINKGLEASKTLSGVGGGEGGELTAKMLAEMSDDEFAAWMDKTPKSKQRALFGG